MAEIITSQHLYQYLCEEVGTEKAVQARRIFFKVNDCSKNHAFSNVEFISSGSKPEGLDLPGSDIDIMYMDKTNVVRTGYSDSQTSLGQTYELFVDTNNTPPGFAKIAVFFPSCDIKSQFICIQGLNVELFQTENESILPNTSIKTLVIQSFESSNDMPQYKCRLTDIMKPHGPCSSTLDEAMDIVFCFRLDEWPREALGWISRPRVHDWPPEDLISDILNEEKAVLLVPIGSKFGAVGDNPHEWRISFSVSEQMLVHSFNHTQIICYAMLKILLKEVIDKEAKNLLCSYFMKTLLFWLIEETGVSMWKPDNLFKCFQACIRKLLYHIKLGYFPNYFILQNNTFEGKIFGKSQEKLHSILHNIYTEGIYFVLRTESLKDLIVSKTTIQIGMGIEMKYYAEDKAIYPLLQYLPYINLCNYSLPKIYLYLTACKSNMIKSLFSMHFVKGCLDAAVSIPYDLTVTNKRCYHQYKSLQSCCVLSSNFNLNGWLLLALFFYQHKQFYNTLRIIDFVCFEITNKSNFICPCTIESGKYTLCEKTKYRGSFLQRYKSLCISPIIITLLEGTVFDKCDFDLTEKLLVIDESTCRFGHYVRFMCYHHLHDLAGSHKALCDLQQVVDTTNNTSPFIVFALRDLFRSYEISNRECPDRNMVKLNDIVQFMLADPLFSNLAIHLPIF